MILLSFYLSIVLSFYLPIHLFVGLSICLCVRLFVYHLSINPSVYLLIYLSLYSYVGLFLFLYFSSGSLCFSVFLYFHFICVVNLSTFCLFLFQVSISTCTHSTHCISSLLHYTREYVDCSLSCSTCFTGGLCN